MTRQDLADWMILYVAVLIGEPSESLSLETPLAEYDFDSIDAVNMALELQDRMDTPVDTELFLDSSRSLLEVLNSLMPDHAEA